MFFISFFRNTVRPIFFLRNSIWQHYVSLNAELPKWEQISVNVSLATSATFITIPAGTETVPCVRAWRWINGLTNSRKTYLMFHISIQYLQSRNNFILQHIQIRSFYMMHCIMQPIRLWQNYLLSPNILVQKSDISVCFTPGVQE